MQLRLQPKLILKLVVFIDSLRLDGGYLAGAIGQVNQALVSKLELALQYAVIFEWDQVCLPQRGVGLHAQLCRRHHGAKEALGRGLRQFGVRRQSGQRDPGEPLRRQHRRQCLCDLPCIFLI